MAVETDTRYEAPPGTPPGTPLDVRSRFWWGSAVGAGIIAGLVFVMAQMLLVWAFLGQSPWGPPRMIAAMALGPEVLPPPAGFEAVPILVAMMIHLVFSILYGIVIGAIVQKMGMGAAVLTGAVFGLVAMYLVNFYLVAPLLFPWFLQATNWITAFNHLLFGLVAGGAYVALRDRHGRRRPAATR